MPLYLTLLALGAFAALALSACGGGSSTTAGTSKSGNATANAGKLHRAITRFGHQATAAQARPAETALLGYLSARAASEWSRACSYLTQPIRHLLGKIAARPKQVQGEGCAGYLQTAAAKLSSAQRADLAKADVTSVRIEASRGYVLYKSAGARQATALRREAGRWKLAATSATELKP